LKQSKILASWFNQQRNQELN